MKVQAGTGKHKIAKASTNLALLEHLSPSSAAVLHFGHLTASYQHLQTNKPS